ncbi:DUF5641 domain-containing protein [Trichonephila clavipes]|nr:DUF5641 domain-containing protein [Trichonephila clavipes]
MENFRVANRTSEIIEVLPTKHWRHVPSKENPADIASRRKKYEALKNRFLCHPKVHYVPLHPFIDEHGLVRVGGRLQNSQLPFNSKHPIILPSQHSISELLIKEQHIAHLHAGPTFVSSRSSTVPLDRRK